MRCDRELVYAFEVGLYTASVYGARMLNRLGMSHTACVHRSLEGCIPSHCGDIGRTLFGLLQQHTVVAVSAVFAAAHHLHMEGASHLGPSNPALSTSNRSSIPWFGWSGIGRDLWSIPCGRHYDVGYTKMFKAGRATTIPTSTAAGKASSASGDLRIWGN
jgi:hypothetical protein